MNPNSKKDAWIDSSHLCPLYMAVCQGFFSPWLVTEPGGKFFPGLPVATELCERRDFLAPLLFATFQPLPAASP